MSTEHNATVVNRGFEVGPAGRVGLVVLTTPAEVVKRVTVGDTVQIVVSESTLRQLEEFETDEGDGEPKFALSTVRAFAALVLGVLLITFGVLLGLVVLTPTAAHATENPDVTLFWSLPGGGTPEHVTWPQLARTDKDCGGWWQADTGPRGPRAAALVADGRLDYKEDWGWVRTWTFVKQPPCVTPTPAPSHSSPAPTTTSAPTATPTPAPSTTPVPTSTPAPAPTETVVVVPPSGPRSPPSSAPGQPAPRSPVVTEVLDATPAPTLPETGSQTGPLAVLGALVVGLGVGLVLLARRARRADA